MSLSRPPTYLDKLPKDLVGYLVDVIHNEKPKYTLIASLCEPLRDYIEKFTQILHRYPQDPHHLQKQKNDLRESCTYIVHRPSLITQIRNGYSY